APNRFAPYTLPRMLPVNTLAYGGQWRGGAEGIAGGRGARIRLHFEASDVYIVLGGRGEVQALVDGKPTATVHVDAERLYTVRTGKPVDATLELRVSRGVQAYSFTFG